MITISALIIILLSIVTIASIIFSVYIFRKTYALSVERDMYYDIANEKEEKIADFILFMKTNPTIQQMLHEQLDHPLLKILLNNFDNLMKELRNINDKIIERYSQYDKRLAEEIEKHNSNKQPISRRKKKTDEQSNSTV